MQLTSEGIILSTIKYGENSGIACVFTEEYGVYKGLVRSISSAKQRGLYQLGNIVEVTWRARLSEHLGNISAGLLYPSASSIMDNPLKLAALSSVCGVLEVALQERDVVSEIYQSFKAFIVQLIETDDEWEKSYILLELELLTQLGFGLDLTSCAATGVKENLIYVSPKSGRAVSSNAGRQYHDKLLKLPSFLLGGDVSNDTNIYPEIKYGLELSSYFLDKYFFAPHNIKQPQARTRFTGMLYKKF